MGLASSDSLHDVCSHVLLLSALGIDIILPAFHMYLDECGLPPTFVFYKWLAFGPYEVSVTHRGPIEGHDIHPGDWAG